MVEIQSLLRDLLSIELSNRTVGHLRSQLRLVGPANRDDFVSSVILECWETRNHQPQMDDKDVFRAIDRVGHRIRRGLRHKTAVLLPEHVEAPARDSADVAELAALRDILDFLNPLELRIVECFFIDGEPISGIALRLGIPKRTLYRRIGELREKLRQAIL